MKKINFIQLIIGAIITVLAVNTVQANESSLDVVYYATSKHFDNQFEYNEKDHQFIGVSYNLEGSSHTLGAATFKNSYYSRSVLVSWGYRWQLSDNIETSLNVGGVTGYFKCKVCPAVEVGIKYTRFKYIQPKLSIFNSAAIFSLSARF